MGTRNRSVSVNLRLFLRAWFLEYPAVDIALVAMVGGLCVINGDNDALKLNSIPGVAGATSACKPSSVPLGAQSANIHDGVDQATVPFMATFPYLNTPNPGSP